MAEKEVVILEIDVNQSKAENELKAVQQRIEELKGLERDLTIKETVELKRLQTEQRALIKIVGSAEGSYDRLSATYARNKAVLNSLTEEQRKSAEIGGKLEEESRKIYAQMNEMQKATGKYVLQVGNYEIAGKALRQELRQLTQALTAMKLEGKENTKEYAEMVKRAGELKDAMGDASKAINNTASDTSNLDAILGAASAATGGFGLVTSAMSIFGAESENVEKAQKKLMQAIALVNSVQALSNALNKDGALMVKLHAIAQKLLSKQMQSTSVATKGASTAMKGFKTALVSTGVGALVVALGFLVEKLIEHNEQAKQASKDEDDLKTSMDRLKESADNLSLTYDELKDARQKYSDAKFDAASDAEKVEILNEKIKEQQANLDGATKSVESYEKSVEKTGKVLARARQDFQVLGGDDRKKAYEEAEAAFNNAKANLQGAQAQEIEYQTTIQTLQKQKRDIQNKTGNEQKKQSDEAIKKAKEYLSLLKDINNAYKSNLRLISDMTAEFLKNDQTAYYAAASGNLLLNQQEEEKAETERYEEEKRKIHKNDTKALEKVEEVHRQNLKIIYLRWKKEQQALDKDYQNYIKTEQEKADHEQEKIDEARLQKQLKYEEDIASAKLLLARNSIDVTMRLKLEELEAEYQAEIKNAQKIGQDTTEIERAYAAEQTRIEMEASAERLSIAQAMVGNISDSLGSLFEENKGMQIASTVASTIADAAATYSKTLAQGGAFATPLAITSAASVVARGIAAIQKLSSTNINSKSIAGGSSISRTTSSVNETIVQRTAGNIVGKSETAQPVLVVDEVTAKQMQISQAQKVAVQ